MTILINPQTRLLAATTLLLITLLCCPSLPEPGTPTPTPPPTPLPILALGEWAAWDHFSVSVESYKVVDRCPEWGEGPAEGAKLLYVWIAMRNDGDKVVQLPASRVTITYGDMSASSTGQYLCPRADPHVNSACVDRMHPGIGCRGWVLFEIPLAHQVANTLVEIQEGPWRGQRAAWRLAGGPGE